METLLRKISSFPNKVFSDKQKGFKILLPLIIIIFCGMYYFNNDEYNKMNRRNFEKLSLSNEGRYICLKRTRIYWNMGKFRLRTMGQEFEVGNLPDIYKNRINSTFAIKGRIDDKRNLHIIEIREQHPRTSKIIVSAITTTFICILFFFYFRWNSGGFIFREEL